MEKIALLYAPAKGSTEKVARMIQQKLGEEKIELILLDENTNTNVLSTFSRFIFGISTVGRDAWDAAYKKTGWDYFLPKLEKVELNGKTIAIYGLGDHLLYDRKFVDSMGPLAEQLLKSGAELVGQTPVDAYTFTDSEAIVNNMFVGLPLDENNEPELTEQRIDGWLKEISIKMHF
jgi:flavodoxin I